MSWGLRVKSHKVEVLQLLLLFVLMHLWWLTQDCAAGVAAAANTRDVLHLRRGDGDGGRANRTLRHAAQTYLVANHGFFFFAQIQQDCRGLGEG